ncbi:hypothetical protein GVX82_03415 [Patescibacteria group bacterium]|jgi:hypothetical protein|nr:hypothetical protein [Patescibacteria group bacterium]
MLGGKSPAARVRIEGISGDDNGQDGPGDTEGPEGPQEAAAREENTEPPREGGGTVAGLALLIAIAALIIAWIAFDRTGEEKLGELVKEQAVETYEEWDQRLFRRQQATSSAATSTGTSTTSPGVSS